MDSDGGQAEANETTSYELRPPVPSRATEDRGPETERSADTPSRGTVTQVVSAPTPPVESQPGRLLGNRYRLTGRLGHGGMGTVWRARDEVVDRDVAIKEPRLPASVADRQRTMVHERMQREARAAARIGHPSIVTVHDVVVEDGQPWLVMELVRGETLADVLETGTLEPREAARIGLAVLEGLAAAHEAGVVHRDVKPANVLLGGYDQVVLTDFGIAQVEGEQGLTETGVFVGSPEFTGPERAQGQRPGPESDLWSLGVLLYVAVEGVSPFRRNNVAATVQAVISSEPPSPVRARGALGELITRLLDKRPGARPRAEEVRRILREVIAAPPTDATRLAVDGASPTGTAPPVRRRRRWAVVGGVGAAVVLVAALLFAPFGPFGGDDGSGLPEGWDAKEEEHFRMTMAVPSSFERVTDEESPDWLLYQSRDDIYEVHVWFWEETEDRGPLQMAAQSLDEMRENTTDYQDVQGDFWETEFQERESAELTLSSRPAYIYDEADDRVTQRMSLFYEGRDNQVWRIQVNMPGERGPARDYGEQLYADIVANLEIRDTEQPAAGEG
ncbi:serine/threonine-protein kinase [Streptomyces sp. B6B3]|uniref:serine/threonine-protein kinase n=1 Tax=Streptomyces sp. B6B3 TaxID=3153570 RepID=UPI00325DC1ED